MQKRPVKSISPDGEVRHYESAQTAARITGTKQSSITLCCQGQAGYRKAGGLRWEYADGMGIRRRAKSEPKQKSKAKQKPKPAAVLEPVAVSAAVSVPEPEPVSVAMPVAVPEQISVAVPGPEPVAKPATSSMNAGEEYCEMTDCMPWPRCMQMIYPEQYARIYHGRGW